VVKGDRNSRLREETRKKNQKNTKKDERTTNGAQTRTKKAKTQPTEHVAKFMPPPLFQSFCRNREKTREKIYSHHQRAKLTSDRRTNEGGLRMAGIGLKKKFERI